MKLNRNQFPKTKPKSYDDVRPSIQSGDLLLCSGSALISRIIQKVTESVWSHVALVMRLECIDRIMVLESVESIGVRTVPLSHYVHNYDGKDHGYPGRLVIARHGQLANVTKARLTKMSKFAVNRFGFPYDTNERTRIAARIVAAKLGFSVGAKERDMEYICSEYIWECYRNLGIRIKFDKRGFIAPADFATDPEIRGVSVLQVQK